MIIPIEQHKALKRYAVDHDTSMSDLLRQWIGEHVHEPREGEKETEQ